MEIYDILGASLCTYGKDTNDIQQRAEKFGLELSNIVQFNAGEQNIDSCYVAEIDDNVILAFRGTLPPLDNIRDWLNDIMAILVKVDDIPGQLHHGFSGSVQRLFDKGFANEVNERMKGEKTLIITGYSKGAALAPIAASFLDKKSNIDPGKMKIRIFEPPRPGDAKFKTYFDENFDTWRYEYQDDIVPHLPLASKEEYRTIKAVILASLKSRSTSFDEEENFQLFPYQAVGKLNFVNWNNHVVDDPSLAEERLKHIDSLVDLKPKKVFTDHLPTYNHLYEILSDGKELPDTVEQPKEELKL